MADRDEEVSAALGKALKHLGPIKQLDSLILYPLLIGIAFSLISLLPVYIGDYIPGTSLFVRVLGIFGGGLIGVYIETRNCEKFYKKYPEVIINEEVLSELRHFADTGQITDQVDKLMKIHDVLDSVFWRMK